MSSYIRKFRSYLRKNESARSLFLVGLVIVGAIAVWGGIRLTLNTEYPIIVVSSGSMCPPNNCILPVGSLIVVRGEDPSALKDGDIVVFRAIRAIPTSSSFTGSSSCIPSNDTLHPANTPSQPTVTRILPDSTRAPTYPRPS